LPAAVAAHPPSAKTTDGAWSHGAAAVPVAALPGHAVVAGEPDRIDHDVVLFGALRHVLQRLVVAGEIERSIDTVGEDEHNPPSLLDEQLVDRAVDGIPQWRRPRLLKVLPDDPEQLFAIRGEVVGIDPDFVGEAADACLVAGPHRADKGLGALRF